jgi:hypothetical protein
MNTDGLGYAGKYMQAYSAKAYRIHNKESVILMQTGYGQYMVEFVLEKIYAQFSIERCFFDTEFQNNDRDSQSLLIQQMQSISLRKLYSKEISRKSQ